MVLQLQTVQIQPVMLVSIVFILSWSNVCLGCQSDVVFLLDNSGSIMVQEEGGETDMHWNMMVDFVFGIVATLNISPAEDRIAAAGFGSNAHIYFDFMRYSTAESFAAARDDAFYFSIGSTNLTGGLRLVRTSLLTPEAGDRADVENIVILLTDGDDTTEREYLHDEAARLKYTGTKIIAVGITERIDEERLKQHVVSWPPLKHFFQVDQFEELTIVLDSVLETCQTVESGNVPCRYVDVMVLVDSAGVFTHVNFDHIINFLQGLVATGDQHMRFGVATFSDHVHEEWSLGEVDQEQLTQLCYLPGQVNSTEVFRYISEMAFNDSRGGARMFAVILTDEDIAPDGNAVKSISEAGIEMVFVSVGCLTNLSDLESLSKQEVIRVREHRDLTSIIHQLRNALCAG